MFKPKAQQQPFYLSWFSSQGENVKRGGTAPNQSRKEKLAIKSPYQQPLVTVSHNQPNPYLKTMAQPKNYQSNIQQISKIYQGSFQLKRKSAEKRYDDGSARGSYKPTRAFTQQNQRPFRFSEQAGRPQTQQLNTLEPKLRCENLDQSSYEEDQLTPRDNEEVEIIEIENHDDFSNESNDADSDGHQNLQFPTQQQEEGQMHKNKSFVQKQQEEPIASMRKATATLNRPQTSEGARRKRFMNSANEQQTTEKKESYDNNIILEEAEQLQIIEPIRSGQRKKITDDEDNYERPPSRHKTPPKATGLDLPIQNSSEIVDIPIKNMYAQIDEPTNNKDEFDDFDLGFFKMNNKVNLNKFQQKDGYHTDLEKIQYSGSKHPQSAKYNTSLGFQSTSPAQITSAHGLREQPIVIKYNTSSALNKNSSNQPIKVPFKTSLGQDFLRLFANDCID